MYANYEQPNNLQKALRLVIPGGALHVTQIRAGYVSRFAFSRRDMFNFLATVATRLDVSPSVGNSASSVQTEISHRLSDELLRHFVQSDESLTSLVTSDFSSDHSAVAMKQR